MTQCKKYCAYFQAYVKKEETWFFVATLRSNEHLLFDRTLDPATGLFEFFVPEESVDRFIALMDMYTQRGLVHGCVQRPNRLITEPF